MILPRAGWAHSSTSKPSGINRAGSMAKLAMEHSDWSSTAGEQLEQCACRGAVWGVQCSGEELGFSAGVLCIGGKSLFTLVTSSSTASSTTLDSSVAYVGLKSWLGLGCQKILGWALVMQNLKVCPYLKHTAHLKGAR
jgi:hypothetical protein